MPIVTAIVSAPRSPERAAALAALLHRQAVDTLRKRADLVAVALQWVDPADWFIAGRPLAGQGLHSAFVDIRITDETNTKDEKARFVAEVFAGLRQLLGPLHDESYVHVHDVRAAAYGYGGRTQEWRYQQALAVSP